MGDIAKELGKAWKVMTTQQKEPFEEKAKTDRQRYEEQKADYLKHQRVNDVDDDEEEDEEDED